MWDLSSIPIHLQAEAMVIRTAKRAARMELAKKYKVPVYKVPEF